MLHSQLSVQHENNSPHLLLQVTSVTPLAAPHDYNDNCPIGCLEDPQSFLTTIGLFKSFDCASAPRRIGKLL
jgi:hypothetical protein